MVALQKTRLSFLFLICKVWHTICIILSIIINIIKMRTLTLSTAKYRLWVIDEQGNHLAFWDFETKKELNEFKEQKQDKYNFNFK